MKHLKYFGMGLLVRVAAVLIGIILNQLILQVESAMLFAIIVSFGVLVGETYLMGKGVSK